MAQPKHVVTIETGDGHKVRLHVHENQGKKPFVIIFIDDHAVELLPGSDKAQPA